MLGPAATSGRAQHTATRAGLSGQSGYPCLNKPPDLARGTRGLGMPGGDSERTVQASSMSAVTALSVSPTPSSRAFLSAMASRRLIRPATASLVIGGSAS